MNESIKLQTHTQESSYNILVTNEKPVFSLVEKISLISCSNIIIITNTVVWKLYGAIIKASFERKKLIFKVIILPDGERHKNLRTVQKIYDRLLSYSADRSSLLIGIGGGVIGDITGFAASTYMRGIKYIQVPTTLLAQVDAAIGGKTGVDHPVAKNIIGTFYQPAFVYSNINFLNSLPERIYTAGMAEVVKYGAISDESIFTYLEKRIPDIIDCSGNILFRLVCDASRIKASIVQKDERETSGVRIVLNFGHTFGHAIEVLSDYEILHGEAVGMGMIIASELSYILGLCRKDVPARIKHLIKGIGLPESIKSFDINRLSKIINYDKKNTGDKISLVLLKKIGVPVVYKIDKKMFKKILMEVRI